MFLYYLVLHSFSIITTYLKGIEFCEHLISQTEKKKNCGYFISRFGDCKTFHKYLVLRFQEK